MSEKQELTLFRKIFKNAVNPEVRSYRTSLSEFRRALIITKRGNESARKLSAEIADRFATAMQN